MAQSSRQQIMRNPVTNTQSSKTATSGLLSLQSAAERRLLDAIDQVRSHDVNHELDLPQLVVCGSQSSGKSSTLEGFSGYSFPRGESTCTRFVTEIQFRRSSTRSVTVAIVDKSSGRQSNASEAIVWSKTEQDLDPKDLPRLIEEAKVKMGISGNKAFSRDVLRLQIAGPDHSPLTLVDLPGIIESHSKYQENIELIKSVVDEWIMPKRSIILVVVDARLDAETQGILTRARQVDPAGERTFGIITKPDLSLHGSKLERDWISHAQNLPGSAVAFPFRKGWHVLLNRGFQEVERETSSRSRDEKEREFFTDSTNAWSEVDPAYWGIDSLRRRLSRLLYEHTRAQLPQVQRDILAKLEEKNAHLERLEEKTKEPERLWADYKRAHMGLLRLVTVGVDGKYNDAFFSDIHGARSLYLRSRIEEQYEDFQRDMVEQGSDIPMPQRDGTQPLDNSILVEEVRKVMRETRGEELPGHFDPQRLDLLFWRHSNAWNSIANRHLDLAHQHCLQFMDQVIHVHLQGQVPGLPTQVCTTIVAALRKSLKKHKQEAKDELQKLETDRARSTKTLNHTFQRVSQENKNKKLQRMFNRAQYVESTTPADPNSRKPRMTPSHISKIAGQEDIATETAETIAEDMLAYLRVARDVFIDNVMVQVIERHLLADLHSLFCGDFGIDQNAFRAMLRDEDYQAIEQEKRDVEEGIQKLQACYDALR